MSLKCSACGKIGSSKDIIFLKKYNNFLCRKHESQFYKYGKILDDNPRTVFDLNDYIVYDEYVEIFLYNKKSEIIAKTLVDIQDFDKIKMFKIRKSASGYAIVGKTKKLLHIFILNPSKNKIVDHINGDSLDNRRCNLREANKTTNGQNSKNKKNNTSGISGVSFNNSENKFETYISVYGKRIKLGYYININDAKYVRYKAELKYFKEFTYNKEEKEKFVKENELLQQENSKVGV